MMMTTTEEGARMDCPWKNSWEWRTLERRRKRNRRGPQGELKKKLHDNPAVQSLQKLNFWIGLHCKSIIIQVILLVGQHSLTV